MESMDAPKLENDLLPVSYPRITKLEEHSNASLKRPSPSASAEDLAKYVKSGKEASR